MSGIRALTLPTGVVKSTATFLPPLRCAYRLADAVVAQRRHGRRRVQADRTGDVAHTVLDVVVEEGALGARNLATADVVAGVTGDTQLGRLPTGHEGGDDRLARTRAATGRNQVPGGGRVLALVDQRQPRVDHDGDATGGRVGLGEADLRTVRLGDDAQVLRVVHDGLRGQRQRRRNHERELLHSDGAGADVALADREHGLLQALDRQGRVALQ